MLRGRRKETADTILSVNPPRILLPSYILPNKRLVNHLNSEAIRNNANFQDTATVISAMWVSTVTRMNKCKNSNRFWLLQLWAT